jgi:hypothetical protein
MRDADAEDVRRMWQEQPREEHTMSTSEIHVKAALLDDRVRRNNAGAALAFGVILIANLLQLVIPGQHSYERVGAALIVLAAASMLWLYWRARSTTVRLDESGLSCVAFYRAQLVRERQLAGRFWLCVLAFVPGILLSLIGGISARPLTPSRMAALAAGGALWIVVVVWMLVRGMRRLQAEIDELDAAGNPLQNRA